MAWSRTLLASTAALLLLLASCAQEPPATLPALTDTTTPVVAIIVGGASTGPVLWGAFDDSSSYDAAYNDIWTYSVSGVRPDWAPDGEISGVWALECESGLREAWVIPDALSDAWDGSNLYVGPDYVTFGVGTLRTYDDGTLLLSCPASNAPTGVTITRHVAVPGAGAEGRFVVELIGFTGTATSGFELAGVQYYLNDGADDYGAPLWATYGSIGPFEWATKDDADTNDPAIGVIPLLSTHFEVDTTSTGGDTYYLAAADGATLAAGERGVLAMVAGIRGGFSAGDAAGKDAAMLALGDELALLDGDAICSVATSGFHVWARLLDGGPAILEAICEGFDAL